MTKKASFVVGRTGILTKTERCSHRLGEALQDCFRMLQRRSVSLLACERWLHLCPMERPRYNTRGLSTSLVTSGGNSALFPLYCEGLRSAYRRLFPPGVLSNGSEWVSALRYVRIRRSLRQNCRR